MLKQIHILTVLVASIYVIDAAQRVSLPSNISRCRRGDSACFSHIFTQLIQNSTEHSEFDIPDLHPYRPQRAWLMRKRGYDVLKFMSYTAHASDICIHGLNTIQMHKFSGLDPYIHAEISIPWLKYSSASKFDLQLLSLLRFPANSDLTLIATDVKIPLHIKSGSIERNGERHLQMKSIDSSVHFDGDLKMDIKFSTAVPEIVQKVLNEQAISNWKHVRPLIEADIEKYVSEIVYEVFDPIFAKVPIRGFCL